MPARAGGAGERVHDEVAAVARPRWRAPSRARARRACAGATLEVEPGRGRRRRRRSRRRRGPARRCSRRAGARRGPSSRDARPNDVEYWRMTTPTRSPPRLVVELGRPPTSIRRPQYACGTGRARARSRGPQAVGEVDGSRAARARSASRGRGLGDACCGAARSRIRAQDLGRRPRSRSGCSEERLEVGPRPCVAAYAISTVRLPSRRSPSVVLPVSASSPKTPSRSSTIW